MNPKPALPHVVFEATTECNLDCLYCYNIWKRPGAEPPRRPGYKDTKRALKRLFSVAEVGHLTMSGGEPLRAERFLELVLFCRMQHKSVTVITNGNAGSREDYGHLVEMGVGLFELPLHAAEPAVHDRMTTVAGSWQRVRESIEILQGLGAEVVVDVVVSRLNADGLGQTLRLLSDCGIRRVMLTRFNVGGNGIRNRDELALDRRGLREAFGQANRAAHELALRVTSNVCTPVCLLNPRDYPHLAFGGCSNDIRRKPLTLDAWGNLRICNHSPVVMGNIFMEAVDAILDSDYVRSWNAVPARCAPCRFWSRCFGGCRGAAEQMGLPLSCEDPVLRQLGQHRSRRRSAAAKVARRSCP